MKIHITTDEVPLVRKIARRGARMAAHYGYHAEADFLHLAIAACHCNGCPLDLAGLLASDEVDFSHDVFGITTHLDRKTGKLTQGFLPRYAAACQGVTV